MGSKNSSDNEIKTGGAKTKKPKSSKKSSAKKPSKKSGLKSKKPAKKSSSKPKSSKKKSSKRGGSHGYAQMFKSSLSPCYEGDERTSWHGGNKFVVPPLENDLMNRELLGRQLSSSYSMDDVPRLGLAEWAATRNESPLQDARGPLPGYSRSDFGAELAPVGKQGGAGKKKKTSSKKKSILGKTKNFLSLLLSKTKSGVKKTVNYVKSKVSGDKKKKSTKKSVKKSTTTDKKKKVKSDKKKKAKKSVKKDK